MNLLNLIKEEHSKRQMQRIVRYVDDQKKFDELISICFGDDDRLAQRASWSLRFCVEKNPSFMKKHIKRMLKQLRKPGHNSIRRNFVKSMEYFDIPESAESETISICFELLNKKEEFVAIKCYSMVQLEKYLGKYPELKEELKASIETQMPFETPAFRSRGKKVLRTIAAVTV